MNKTRFKLITSCLILAPLALVLTVACSPADTDAASLETDSATADTATSTEDVTRQEPFEIDTALRELEIRAALLEHIGLESLVVGVDTMGDKVVLSGEVEDEATKKLAKQTVLSVDGVSDVDNRLTVAEPSESAGTPIARAVETSEREIADALLETRIKAALTRELGRTGFGIDVESVDGSVSLRGEVPSDEARELALQLVSDMEAVDELHDLLTVES